MYWHPIFPRNRIIDLTSSGTARTAPSPYLSSRCLSVALDHLWKHTRIPPGTGHWTVKEIYLIPLIPLGRRNPYTLSSSFPVSFKKTTTPRTTPYVAPKIDLQPAYRVTSTLQGRKGLRTQKSKNVEKATGRWFYWKIIRFKGWLRDICGKWCAPQVYGY